MTKEEINKRINCPILKKLLSLEKDVNPVATKIMNNIPILIKVEDNRKLTALIIEGEVIYGVVEMMAKDKALRLDIFPARFF